jgi:hypothetical protein
VWTNRRKAWSEEGMGDNRSQKTETVVTNHHHRHRGDDSIDGDVIHIGKVRSQGHPARASRRGCTSESRSEGRKKEKKGSNEEERQDNNVINNN